MGGLSAMNPPRNYASSSETPPSSQRATFRFDLGSGGRILFTSSGGAATRDAPIPLREAFGAGTPGPRPGMAPHPLEDLLTLLTGAPLGAPGGTGGQWGDYVLDQHGLDEIITRLMEQSQGQRPVPAPDEMIEKLPRTHVAPGSALTEKECAVCKDTFEPSENELVITLPCSSNQKYQHTFHKDCIVPWLKQNGTCPVCRFQLVPQPQHGGIGVVNMPPGTSEPTASPNPRTLEDGSQTGPSTAGGLRASMSGLWDMFTGHSPSPNPSGDSQRQSRPGTGPPGSWDSLD